jgi:hypothetical protein
MGAAAPAGGEAGHLAQLEHDLAGGGVAAAAFGVAGKRPPGQLVAPPGPGLALKLVAGRPVVEDAGDAEAGGGSIEGGAAGPPSAARSQRARPSVGEAVEQVQGAAEGVAEGVGKVRGPDPSSADRARW